MLPFGVPVLIMSDRGPEWINRVWSSLTDLLGTRHVTTTTYRPQANGAVERVHRYINTVLGEMTEAHGRDWDVMLPVAVMAHNWSNITGTEYSPYRLIFGRDPPSLDFEPKGTGLELRTHHEFVQERDWYPRND